MKIIYNVRYDVLEQKKKRLKVEIYNIFNVIYDKFMQLTSCLADFVNKKKRTQKSFSSCQSKLLSVDIEVLLSCYLNCNRKMSKS